MSEKNMIKKFLAGSLLIVMGMGTAMAQANVGVSIGINQPGVYGRIDIGNQPPPAVILTQPVVIVRQATVTPVQPVYLYVPPGHQKKWGKHCAKYNACAQPVYFVRENWVREQYVQQHPDWREERHGKRRGKHDD